MTAVKNNLRLPLRSYFLQVLVPIGTAVLLINRFVPAPERSDPKAAAALTAAAGNEALAEEQVSRLIAADSLNLELHRAFIMAHFERPKITRGRQARDDSTIVHRYRAYAASTDPAVRDVGNYCLGLCEMKQERYASGFSYLDRVVNPKLPFLNNSKGFALQKMGRTDLAERFFLRELDFGSNAEGAVSNLSRLYYDRKDFGSLSEMRRNAAWERFIPEELLRFVLLHDRNVAGYFRQWMKSMLGHSLWDGILAAALILVLWFVYFVKIDVFEPERLGFLALTLGLGMLFCLFCTVLYDTAEYAMGFRLTGRVLNDLVFCIVGIGLIEETVKVIPVLILIRFTRQVDESFDYILYAAVSALGFAFIENLGYFQLSGLQNISGRALSAVMVHMGLTSLVMYGTLMAKRRRSRNVPAVFALSLAAACVIHGLYDFCLIGNEKFSGMFLLSFVILVLLVQGFGTVINNSINISAFFEAAKAERLSRMGRYLAYSLPYIAAFQYAVMAVRFGPQNANAGATQSLVVAFILAWIVWLHLGNFEIEKDRLFPLFRKIRIS
jgi:RsiW-degrading membrane proteinase PrsW (M82 family)